VVVDPRQWSELRRKPLLKLSQKSGAAFGVALQTADKRCSGPLRPPYASQLQRNRKDPVKALVMVRPYKSENTKTLGVRFSALLTGGGAERLELARA
jgi:hypothetical protein